MGLLDEAKTIAHALQEAKNLTLYQQFMGLYGNIMDMLTENRNLRDERDDLKSKLELKAKMEFREPFYYQEGDKTPFCQHCFESGHKAIHLILAHHNNFETRWDCPACKQMYLIRPDDPRPPTGNSGPGGENSWMAK